MFWGGAGTEEGEGAGAGLGWGSQVVVIWPAVAAGPGCLFRRPVKCPSHRRRRHLSLNTALMKVIGFNGASF